MWITRNCCMHAGDAAACKSVAWLSQLPQRDQCNAATNRACIPTGATERGPCTSLRQQHASPWRASHSCHQSDQCNAATCKVCKPHVQRTGVCNVEPTAPGCGSSMQVRTGKSQAATRVASGDRTAQQRAKCANAMCNRLWCASWIPFTSLQQLHASHSCDPWRPHRASVPSVYPHVQQTVMCSVEALVRAAAAACKPVACTSAMIPHNTKHPSANCEYSLTRRAAPSQRSKEQRRHPLSTPHTSSHGHAPYSSSQSQMDMNRSCAECSACLDG